MTIAQTASGLVNEGYAFTLPKAHGIPASLVDDTNEAVQSLIKIYAAFGNTFSLVRCGECPLEPDMMFPVSDVSNGKDIKSKLHYSHDLLEHSGFKARLLQMSVSEKRHWQTVRLLYEELNRFTLELLQELYNSYNDLFIVDVVREFVRTVTESIPYNTTTLRGLWYPPQTRVHVARPHIDRCLLTNHLGDTGGELQAHVVNSVVKTISPAKGEIVTFWGVKSLFATNGKRTPLQHGAVASNEEDRQALVHFAHADVGYDVRDAGEAREYFYRSKMH